MANEKTKHLIARSLDSIRRSHAVLRKLETSRSHDEEVTSAFRLEIEKLQAQLKEIAQQDPQKIIH
jgi:hypothetical protein